MQKFLGLNLFLLIHSEQNHIIFFIPRRIVRGTHIWGQDHSTFLPASASEFRDYMTQAESIESIANSVPLNDTLCIVSVINHLECAQTKAVQGIAAWDARCGSSLSPLFNSDRIVEYQPNSTFMQII